MVYSTGRRKESIAKVWVSSGTGLITVNKKKFEDYFKDNALRNIWMQKQKLLNEIEVLKNG